MKKHISSILITVLVVIISIVILPGSEAFAQANQQTAKKQLLITNVRTLRS